MPPSSQHSDDAFTRFVEANLARLVLFVIMLGASEADAEDAVAEALIQARQKWAEIQKPGRWVRVAARHLYLDTADRRRAELPNAIAGGFTEVLASADNVSFGDHETDYVIQLLRSLPEHQAYVIALQIDGFETDEIAEIIGCSPATVRSHRRHARAKLRSCLALDDGLPVLGTLLEGGRTS